jgi:alpha-galactosidase
MRNQLLAMAVTCGLCAYAGAAELNVSELDLALVKQGWGVAQRDRGVTSNALTIAGQPFARGVGTHAPSTLWVELDGKATAFRAQCGVDGGAGARGTVRFMVVGDGRVLWKSDVLKGGQAAVPVQVDLAGVKSLLLIAADAGDGKDHDHANWADAVVTFDGEQPKLAAGGGEIREVLTPPAPTAPRINGPRVYGASPGKPFLYRIPCTGERPMTFAAEGLPEGLSLDAASGIITGAIKEGTPRTHTTYLTARNGKGAARREFRIVAGGTLSLTPQMGYNHWYTHYNRITQKMMEEAADILIRSGMADAGYEYVNVDDCWMNAPAVSKYQTDPQRVGPLRDEAGNIQPNVHFPDMKGLADYIHARGLKAGLYTSPGSHTCAGFGGALGFEENDARQFAAWGFDFLKYDWCSYGRVAGKSPSLEGMQKPYVLMGDLLKRQPRDIVFNLCQYGMGDVWKWGAQVGGHSWRTGGDLGFELERIFEIAIKNCGLRDYNKPGGFNDPDYLQIGWHGAQRGGTFELSQPCPLTPNEQYSFMSLWCLMAAPLFYSGDIQKLDAFTLGILCNHELIEINQDPLGQCAKIVKQDGDGFVMVKDLEDGGKAIGLCNQARWPQPMRVAWADAGVTGSQAVRDSWRQQDLGSFTEGYEAVVPPRFVLVLRLAPPARP